ncbi:ABC transporter ATP-binding protein [Acidiferrimicrobium sp. IK]|uniref:ABC transporter ATP-binding protein n=1 Tax=Acidiferrimicrobium sp. IK TaxID=2871700 RepID=UPI0021CB2170|nr:ABC transporter ATP-binding protein [Acidiferrimicrobium sp. IK]MCU4183893.1 ABC transporter ATP-binding protein [Acidiferrimicrobium sp. IK]
MSETVALRGVWATYGRGWVLQDVTLDIEKGRAVAVLGANGAGKTTLTRVLAGVLPPRRGTLLCGAEDMTLWTPRSRTHKARISVVPEGRMIFPALTVQENLLVARRGAKHQVAARMGELLDAFPRLAERRGQLAGSLSGGEQQMLAVSRALMTQPDYLVVDEPSLGLAPEAVARLYSVLARLRHDYGIGVVLAEQNVRLALQVADFAYVLRAGKVVAEGPCERLLDSGILHDAYLGLP